MRTFAAFLLFTLTSTGVLAEKVAVMSKVSGEVLLRKADAPAFNQTPTRGTLLENNDRVKVNDGFAIMLLLDDQSQFKLRENTEVALTLVQDLSGVAYHIRLDYGQSLTHFTAQTGSSFYVHTPTSVVSVKGTSFWTISDPESGDQVIVLDGEVDVMNNLTGQTSTAVAGQSVRSSLDGTLQSAPTVESEIPEDPDPADGFGAVEPEDDSRALVSEVDPPKPPTGQTEAVEVKDKKHSKRDLGLILGLIMVLLVAALL